MSLTCLEKRYFSCIDPIIYNMEMTITVSKSIYFYIIMASQLHLHTTHTTVQKDANGHI